MGLYNAGQIVGTDNISQPGKSCGIGNESSSIQTWIDPMITYNHIWVGTTGRVFQKVNLDTWTVVQTYDPGAGSGHNQAYEMEIDVERRLLFATTYASPWNTIIVINLNTLTHYIRSFTGFDSTGINVMVKDPFTTKLWIGGGSSTSGRGRVVVYDYVADQTIANFEVWEAGKYFSRVGLGGNNIYNATFNSSYFIAPSLPYLVRIDKNNYTFTYVQYDNQRFSFRHSTIGENYFYYIVSRFYDIYYDRLAESTIVPLYRTRQVDRSIFTYWQTIDPIYKKAYLSPITDHSSNVCQKFDLTTMTLEITSQTGMARTLGTASIYDTQRNLWYRGIHPNTIQVINPQNLTFTNITILSANPLSFAFDV